MERLPNEKRLNEHGCLTLTDKAVIQENGSRTGNLNYTEIPIKKIDSIARRVVYSQSLIIVGIMFLVGGVISFSITNEMQGIPTIFCIFGLIALFLFSLTGRKEIIIRAGTATIVENAKGANNFIRKLRQEIHK